MRINNFTDKSTFGFDEDALATTALNERISVPVAALNGSDRLCLRWHASGVTVAAAKSSYLDRVLANLCKGDNKSYPRACPLG